MSHHPSTYGYAVSSLEEAVAPGPEPITGKSVTLVRLSRDHYPGLYENVGSHHDIFTWWPEGPYHSAAEFDKALDELFNMAGLLSYTVFPNSGPNKDKPLGLILLMVISLKNRTSEAGALFGPALQKSREATEAFYLLCNTVFEKHTFRRMAWETNSGNLASRAAAERMGLVYEGTFRQEKIWKGRNRDTAWYSMIDSDWPTSKKTFETWLKDENFDEQGKQKKSMKEIRTSFA